MSQIHKERSHRPCFFNWLNKTGDHPFTETFQLLAWCHELQFTWTGDLRHSLPSLKKSSFPSLDYALFPVSGAGYCLSDFCKQITPISAWSCFKPWENRAATPWEGLLCWHWEDETLFGTGQSHFPRKLSPSDHSGQLFWETFSISSWNFWRTGVSECFGKELGDSQGDWVVKTSLLNHLF